MTGSRRLFVRQRVTVAKCGGPTARRPARKSPPKESRFKVIASLCEAEAIPKLSRAVLAPRSTRTARRRSRRARFSAGDWTRSGIRLDDTAAKRPLIGASRACKSFSCGGSCTTLRHSAGLVGAAGHLVGDRVPARPALPLPEDRPRRSGQPLDMNSLRLVLTLCAGLAACGALANPAAAQECDPLTDAHCHPHSHHWRPATAPSVRLLPVREYIKATDIPPSGVGGYGIVAFTSKTTSATRAKLLMVCRSFVAHFPSNAGIPPTSPLSDRMITVWPLDDPKAEKTAADDCDYAVDHYDLFAGEFGDRRRRTPAREFEGRGAIPDRLVAFEYARRPRRSRARRRHVGGRYPGAHRSRVHVLGGQDPWRPTPLGSSSMILPTGMGRCPRRPKTRRAIAQPNGARQIHRGRKRRNGIKPPLPRRG